MHRLLKPQCRPSGSPAGDHPDPGVLVAHAATVVAAPLRAGPVAVLRRGRGQPRRRHRWPSRPGRAHAPRPRPARLPQPRRHARARPWSSSWRGWAPRAPDAFFVFGLAVVALPATRFALLLLRGAPGPAPPAAGGGAQPRAAAGTAGRRPGLDAAAAADAGADRAPPSSSRRPPAWPGTCGPRSSSRSAAVLLFTARGVPSCWCTPCWPRRSALSDADYLLAVGDEVRALRPEVAVYFSGSASSVYQVNMWLPVLEQLDRRPVVVLRERANLRRLDETTLPGGLPPRRRST